MRNTLLLLIFSLILSCKPSNSINTKADRKVDYEVVQVPIVQENDTIISNELRFYEITSALNSMQLMYDNFGKWDLTLAGRYQHNVPQLIWKNVDLIGNGNKYTISANGTETTSDFFTSFVILDQKGNDALTEKNESRNAIIDYLRLRMRKLGSAKEFYSIYRKK
ncbi:hypothetical protein G5B37_03515 [Rasiella rasia]|uniref:Uncharacterized protein n=1 Tax=Rasiella rasia TaxID=2744027 RepID=A0A6G6GJI4_9FLAO|nr:hypothetical protein [Rasiella rasia]QIE58660.1 hypothetical protein G5B37_03515 [Rasiella rasia]